jgi:hypothetical protein
MDYNLAIREATDIPLRQVTITDALPPEFHYVASVNGSPTPSVSGNTLSWSFSAPVDNIILSAIASGSENLSFEVKAVADGTAVNTATGTATDAVGGPETVIPGTVTNTVVQATTPAFEGLNGDVQAGGGPCGGQLSSGFVAGFSNADSYATYAVSATGSISNFSSNSGHNNLTLGASGGYNKVCEPDLYVAVQNGFKTTPGTTLPANSATHPYDISNWSGVYYITGNAYITASSVVSNKMTIVAMGGSVYIRGTIALTNVAKTPSTAPSVGIIAADNINIAAPVTRVDAYMSADGTIDTCQSGTGSCLSNLTVNGFLMGNNILFNRLGPANGNGSPVAEKVALNPQIYLNPPVFFDTAHTESIPLIGQGEGQPLF